jgi:beta-lactamase regulating signal transducer with metallopeptidase domain
MFAARCLGVSLAVFVLLYISLSVAVGRGWKLVSRVFRPGSTRGSADLLFVLRMVPFALSCAFTLAFTLPSFLLLEPRGTDEAIGTAPIALGLCCLALFGIGLLRAYAAQVKTARAMTEWLNGASVMEYGPEATVLQTGKHSPSLTVAGVCAPKVLVSEDAVATLTPSELRTALRHEMAHVRRYDNLKKLLFRFSVFPGMNNLERAWSEEAEMAADDAAVSSFRDALDLAAALIKVSRLGPIQSSAELTTGLLHSSTALSVRIQRLFGWDKTQASQPASLRWRYALPTAAVTVIILVTSYNSVLTQMHAVTEWLVR